ncbi:MAG: Glycosyl transferase group 1 [Candidatus Uhrbacteria bacterium GW2011_GWE2_45_35]|uniref:Glycosyl transferase group 1 n=2 Tax=Candidatus Uhriibacteriota TaxID=1752732 RepID=A0A0G1JK86_9BACT|nr:MAG: Glycosyl transferase group 1 [Candidatus Uhrbacteria bacterium GW2011_GWF2_44_350]KKU08747.1 MAG: Glycosyl transferase group 1 [Candidatus Uhrbacteria bacterium GW2011_GWE2_45_35]
MTPDFPPRTGGVARYLAALALYFKNDLRVITTPEKDCEVFDAEAPYPIERRDLFFKNFWPRWFKTVWLLIKEGKSFELLIVSHVLPFGTAAWLSKFVTKKSYMVIVHGMDVSLACRSKQKRWLTEKVLRGAKVVITNTKALAAEVERDFGVKRTVVCYPGIKNLGHLAPDQEESGRSKRDFVLLTVSRLVSRKGHLRVLKAISELQEQIPNLRYRIIGEGPELAEIIRVANELGIYDLLRLNGRVTDTEIAEAYDEADIFVMPTVVDEVDREGFGIVYLEAAVHGLPSIATDHPGVDEAVINNQTGLLVPDGDIEALKEAILRLRSNPKERRSLGSAARSRATEDFVWEKSFEKLKSFL